MKKPSLQKPVQSLPLIGPAYQKRLKRLDIHTVGDLLHHYPLRYEDRSLSKPSEIQIGETVTLSGEILSIRNIRTRSGKTLQKGMFAIDTDSFEVVWFNQPYLIQAFNKNPHVTLTGKFKTYRGQPSLQVSNYELLKDGKTPTTHTGDLVAMYPQTSGVSSKWLRSRLKMTLKKASPIPDWLPKEIRQQKNLVNLNTALHQIHFPENTEILEKARHRLSFDELLLIQLRAQFRKRQWQEKATSHQFEISDNDLKPFIASLPFTLTNDQLTAIKEITTDLNQPHPMNRLLQGDVGSGKTVVAAAALFASAKKGLPGVLMAPTEVLANQHAKSIKKLLTPHQLEISIQTRTHKDPISDQPIIIGTHALLHRQLPEDIGVLVIDEQHRFGVNQRAKLLKRPNTPHLLSMTATPIPRTIALTLHADLDISTITEMPYLKPPIKTRLVPHKKRSAAFNWVKERILKNQEQAFIVCPLIEESEHESMNQVKAATTQFKVTKKRFPKMKVALLHGKMKSDQKQAVLKRFHQGNTDILVTTPVIEVGIDVKNATIMVIEGAERFGLAQLHQLRGRVGRAEKKGYCLIFTSHKKPSKRLKYLESIHSGHQLAELDLKMRGPGELYGLKQSGHIDLKIASLAQSELIQTTHQIANTLINQDPKLNKHPEIKAKLAALLEKEVKPN